MQRKAANQPSVRVQLKDSTEKKASSGCRGLSLFSGWMAENYNCSQQYKRRCNQTELEEGGQGRGREGKGGRFNSLKVFHGWLWGRGKKTKEKKPSKTSEASKAKVALSKICTQNRTPLTLLSFLGKWQERSISKEQCQPVFHRLNCPYPRLARFTEWKYRHRSGRQCLNSSYINSPFVLSFSELNFSRICKHMFFRCCSWQRSRRLQPAKYLNRIAPSPHS